MFKKPEDQEKTGILDSIKEDRYVLIVAVAVLLFISGAIIAFQPALQNESQALAPVTMLSASVQDGNVSLSWKASDSAAAIGYDIYLSIEPDVLGGKINTEPISGLSYMDTVAVPGTYYYTIRTVSETGDDGNTVQLQIIAEAPAAPTSLFISINDGAEYTNEGSVSLSLSADGAQECRYKNTEDSEWGEYEEYQASKRWELGSGEDGLRSVEYQCKGNDGTESEIISGSIILDSQVPIFWYALSTSGGAAQATVIVTNETAANSIACTPIIDLSEGEPFIIDIDSGTGSYTYIRQLNPGSHSFSLSCHDEAGNAKSTMPRAFQVK